MSRVIKQVNRSAEPEYSGSAQYGYGFRTQHTSGLLDNVYFLW
jgi:hypothetical protein